MIKKDALAWAVTSEARREIGEIYLPRIERSLAILGDEDIWWRPNPASNSAGNLVLHLTGNVRQWIISGLGGAPDHRKRDSEFAEQGPIPRRRLSRQLRMTVEEACRVIENLPPSELLRERTIQKFRVTGVVAVLHVVDHFALHAGQILYITKMRRGRDLKFTKLPGERRPSPKANNLPSV